MTPLERLDELLGRRVSGRSLAVVRCLVGAVAAVHLWRLSAAALRGDTYHDRFHHAYASWLPEFGPSAFTVLLVGGTLSACAMSVGLFARASSMLTFGVVAYHLALSTTHVHNNRAYLAAVLAILAMAPAGRAFSLDAVVARRRGRPLDDDIPAWPIWLLRFECALVYGASGVSKLVDPDWFGGSVTWGRMIAQEAMIRTSAMPDFVADIVLDRSFHTVAAKAIVATELFIATGLWWHRTRLWAVATAVVFHVMIELSAEVQLFSYLGVAVLVIWFDPAMRSRWGRVVQNQSMEPARPAEHALV